MILDKFPSTQEFYDTYWGKKPFIVKQGIDPSIFDSLIDGNTLAALAMEEDVKSRIVITEEAGNKWSCKHGPFEEEEFSNLDDSNWSLLVQNVEQYHTDTAQLLQHFHFSPRWLMDDVMVSYSTTGGTVGPHTDSYHVFLVQGQGTRRWKVSDDKIDKEDCIEGMDLKVLKDTFKGKEFDVSMGDVIYIPPHFGHEGITIEDAMTFSVGFLGPQISELLSEYGRYIENNKIQDSRYSGHNLTPSSSGFIIDETAIDAVQNTLITSLRSDEFSKWITAYFSTPTHCDIDDLEDRAPLASNEDIFNALKNGASFYRPEYIKTSLTKSSKGNFIFSIYGVIVPTLTEHQNILQKISQNQEISYKDIEHLDEDTSTIALVTRLFNGCILEKR